MRSPHTKVGLPFDHSQLDMARVARTCGCSRGLSSPNTGNRLCRLSTSLLNASSDMFCNGVTYLHSVRRAVTTSACFPYSCQILAFDSHDQSLRNSSLKVLAVLSDILLHSRALMDSSRLLYSEEADHELLHVLVGPMLTYLENLFAQCEVIFSLTKAVAHNNGNFSEEIPVRAMLYNKQLPML
jgi:hypothetical protein